MVAQDEQWPDRSEEGGEGGDVSGEAEWRERVVNKQPWKTSGWLTATNLEGDRTR